MNRVKKVACTYLSCNVKMEFFTTSGSQAIRVKIIDLLTRRYIVLRDDEVYKLICQIAAYESIDVSHPVSWKEFLCSAFSLKRYFPPSKYILLTKYHCRITLDKQCIATLLHMEPKFNQCMDKLALIPFANSNSKIRSK